MNIKDFINNTIELVAKGLYDEAQGLADVASESLVTNLPENQLIAKAQKGSIEVLRDVKFAKAPILHLFCYSVKDPSFASKDLINLPEFYSIPDSEGDTGYHCLAMNASFINKGGYKVLLKGNTEIVFKGKNNKGVKPIEYMISVADKDIVKALLNTKQFVTQAKEDDNLIKLIIGKLENEDKDIASLLIKRFPETASKLLASKGMFVDLIVSKLEDKIKDIEVDYNGAKVTIADVATALGIPHIYNIDKLIDKTSKEEIKAYVKKDKQLAFLLAHKGDPLLFEVGDLKNVFNEEGNTPYHEFGKVIAKTNPEKLSLLEPYKDVINARGRKVSDFLEDYIEPMPKDELIKKAKKGDSIVLKDPMIFVEKDDNGVPVFATYVNNIRTFDPKLFDYEAMTTLQDPDGNTPFHYIVSNSYLKNEPKFVKFVINKQQIPIGDTVNKTNITPLHSLCNSISNFDLVPIIVKHPKIATAFCDEGLSPLIILCKRVPASDTKAVRVLATFEDSNAFPLEPEKNALTYLARRGIGFNWIVNRKDLAETMFSMSKKTEIPLLNYIASKGYDQILNTAGIENVKDTTGNTPAHVLAMNGNDKVLDYKKLLRIKNNEGLTPLHYLAKAGIDIINKVSGINMLEMQDNFGNTPYHYYAAYLAKNYNSVKVKNLLDVKGVCSVQNNEGNTVCHILANGGIREIAYIPESNDLKNKDGKTAIQILIEKDSSNKSDKEGGKK